MLLQADTKDTALDQSSSVEESKIRVTVHSKGEPRLLGFLTLTPPLKVRQAPTLALSLGHHKGPATTVQGTREAREGRGERTTNQGASHGH